MSAQIAAHAGFLRNCLGLRLDASSNYTGDATALVGLFSEASGISYKTIFPPARAGRASKSSETATRLAIGAFLAHLSMAIRSLKFSKQSPQGYKQAYKLTKRVPALRMCGLFTTMEVMTVTVEGSAVILNHAPLHGSVALLVCLAGAVSLQSHSVLADHALVLCDFNTGRGGDGLALQVRAEQGSPCVVVLLSVAGPAVLSSATAKQVEQWSRVASEIEEARKHHHKLLRARKPCGCIEVAASAGHGVNRPAAGAAGASSAARGKQKKRGVTQVVPLSNKARREE